MKKQLITPHFWFDTQAIEAAEFYAATFGGNSGVRNVTKLNDTPSGSVDLVQFTILGYDFEAMSAGPMFKINPSVSFHMKCKTPQEVDAIWEKLAPDGSILMDLGTYDFSQRYGWVEDKYGVSWQIIHTKEDFDTPITPVMMFTKDVCGKAEDAINFYASVFPDGQAQVLARYSADDAPNEAGTVKYSTLILDGQELGAMDSSYEHDFKFNEAVSFIIQCKDQAEIDYYWDTLSAVPEAEACGWIKDKYGVSWQIVPANIGEIMTKNLEATTPVLLEMKKIIISELEAVAETS